MGLLHNCNRSPALQLAPSQLEMRHLDWQRRSPLSRAYAQSTTKYHRWVEWVLCQMMRGRESIYSHRLSASKRFYCWLSLLLLLLLLDVICCASHNFYCGNYFVYYERTHTRRIRISDRSFEITVFVCAIIVFLPWWFLPRLCRFIL